MQLNGKVFGLEIAEVVELEEDSHRVKLKFDAWTEDETSHWAPVATLMAGNEMGFYCMPNQGDKVLVGFHQGDRHQPYVIGALWTDEQKPPVTDINSTSDRNADGDNLLRYWKTPSGHMIILDDTKDAEAIQIIDRTGNKKIEMICGQSDDDHQINIENSKGPLNIKAPDGKLTIECKEMEISVQEKLNIKSGQAMEIKSDDKITVEASQDLELKGSNVKTEAQQNAEIKGNVGVKAEGTTIDIEATASLGLKSNGMSELKGTPVKIN
jgi:uncharacterized protein involved in type VI secretion and phage assembly